jgi:tRNA dimethylallyltransferase
VADLVEETPAPLLVVLLGPTGSGKTSLSIALAQRFHGEVVSCDSVAVYRGLEIGSAKPSPEQRSLVTHHLIDVVDPDAFYTAGDYARTARETLAHIASKGNLPIVTGGTGLYLRALLMGLFPGPQRSAALRDRLLAKAAARGSEYLHRILKRLDPMSASRIHANDTPKIVRAIEVALTSSRPLSEGWKDGRDPLQGFRILRLGLNPERARLYERINARAREMFATGLVQETQGLLARYGKVPALDALGYRQAAQLLAGAITLEQAIAAASQGHRNYAKRQLTWFRREPEVFWLDGFGDEHAVRAKAETLICERLKS